MLYRNPSPSAAAFEPYGSSIDCVIPTAFPSPSITDRCVVSPPPSSSQPNAWSMIGSVASIELCMESAICLANERFRWW